MAIVNTPIESPDSGEAAILFWISPKTSTNNLSRCNTENTAQRTIAGVELYRAGYYKSLAAASRDLKVGYWRLYSRLKGSHIRSQNGGNHTLFSKEEECAILLWAHRRVTHGHHIQIRALRQHANSVLRAKGRPPTASRTWARRLMRRWKHAFHRKKSTTRDAKRKSMEDCGHVEKWFEAWRTYMRYAKADNVWNIAEISFMIGCLLKGTFLWTFAEFERPILTYMHDIVSMAVINAVDTPPFNVRVIQRHQEYVALRIEASIVSSLCFTPSVARLHEKSRKATEVLMINGITATQEMKRLKEKNIHRRVLQEGTSIVSNYGPIRVRDARLRIAKDDYHRRAAQAEEGRHFRKNGSLDEVKYIHRWMKDVRSLLWPSLNDARGVEARRGWWVKGARQKLLSSNEDMGKRYALIREFQEELGVSVKGNRDNVAP
ncbi:hypothetical protein ACKRZS_007155 [Fusarium odoratissimum]